RVRQNAHHRAGRLDDVTKIAQRARQRRRGERLEAHHGFASDRREPATELGDVLVEASVEFLALLEYVRPRDASRSIWGVCRHQWTASRTDFAARLPYHMRTVAMTVAEPPRCAGLNGSSRSKS